MDAAMLYVGDRLKLYETLRSLCGDNPELYISEQTLAEETGLHVRWLREWLAHHAAMGVLLWKPDKNYIGNDPDAALVYRLPQATAEVLANPDSKEYDISMIEMVPALVARAKTMLPEAFQTGIGRPYDEPDVASAINRQHTNHVRDIVIPEVIPMAGPVQQQLETGILVADLGCGAGILMVQLAQAFPNSTFHGYEISQVALQKAAQGVAKAKLTNVFLHDATVEPLGEAQGKYDLVLVYDVFHDSTQPLDLIRQIKTSLKKGPDTQSHLLCADIPSAPSIQENIESLKAPAATYFAMSTCLCLSCSMSEPGGTGLGTLGFSVPVAQDLLVEQGGFSKMQVLLEKQNARWFLVTP